MTHVIDLEWSGAVTPNGHNVQIAKDGDTGFLVSHKDPCFCFGAETVEAALDTADRAMALYAKASRRNTGDDDQ